MVSSSIVAVVINIISEELKILRAQPGSAAVSSWDSDDESDPTFTRISLLFKLIALLLHTCRNLPQHLIEDSGQSSLLAAFCCEVIGRHGLSAALRADALLSVAVLLGAHQAILEESHLNSVLPLLTPSQYNCILSSVLSWPLEQHELNPNCLSLIFFALTSHFNIVASNLYPNTVPGASDSSWLEVAEVVVKHEDSFHIVCSALGSLPTEELEKSLTDDLQDQPLLQDLFECSRSARRLLSSATENLKSAEVEE